MSASRDEYIRLIWKNKTTPLSAQNFNHMEEGIELNNALAKECANFLDEIKSAIIDQLFFSIDPSTKRVTLRFGTPAPQEGEEEQEGVYYTPNFFAEKVISFEGFCKTNELNILADKKIELLEFNGFVSGTSVGLQIAEGEIKYCTSGSNEGVVTNENSYNNVFLAKVNGELTVVEPNERTLYLEVSSYKIYKYKNVQSGDKLKQISSMVLGNTEQTAYRGDKGNANEQAIEEIKNSYCEFSGIKDFLNGIRTYTISSYDEDGDFAVLASYDYEGYGWKLDNLNKIYAGNFEDTFVVMQTEDSTSPGNYVTGTCDCVRFMNLADPINAQDAANKRYVDSGLAGKADLVNGVVPASQLPSFVDDVIEFLKQVNGSSWLNTVLETTVGTRVFNNATASNLTGGTSSPYYKKFLINTDGTEAGLIIESPDSGKIYVSTDNSNTYRWSGSNLVEISKSLALGETASTAYAGNKGKANAQAIEALQTTVGQHSNTLTGFRYESNVDFHDVETREFSIWGYDDTHFKLGWSDNELYIYHNRLSGCVDGLDTVLLLPLDDPNDPNYSGDYTTATYTLATKEWTANELQNKQNKITATSADQGKVVTVDGSGNLVLSANRLETQWYGTQAEYDALSSYDSNTIYNILEN